MISAEPCSLARPAKALTSATYAVNDESSPPQPESSNPIHTANRAIRTEVIGSPQLRRRLPVELVAVADRPTCAERCGQLPRAAKTS